MKLFVENNSSKFPIILGADGDSTPTGYLDETTIIGVGNNLHLENLMEFNSIRDWVLLLLLEKDADQATAFGLCSLDEKKVVCKFILMPYSVRIAVLTDAEDEINWDKLVHITEGSPFAILTGRSKVYHRLRVQVSQYVRKEVWFPNDYFANLTYAQAFLKDVHLIKEYFIASNNPEFGNFLKSINEYEFNGFNSKNYWLQSLEDDLLEIYNSY